MTVVAALLKYLFDLNVWLKIAILALINKFD